MNQPTLVIGDGWAALGAVGYLVAEGRPVRWLAASGSRLLAPLPTVEVGEGLLAAPAWAELARRLGIEAGQPQTGSYLREFRNKAFRQPSWTKSPTPAQRAETLSELLWGPERAMGSVFEARFELPLSELETRFRERLTAENFPGLIERIEGVPLADVLVADGRVRGVLLASGQELEAARIIYADRWSSLSSLPSLPKALPFNRRRAPTGVIQAVLNHAEPVGGATQEGFFGTVTREAGEESDRHVWGHFMEDGRRSVWTLCLSPEEVEDNHLIAKKLRRMKTALDKMFTGEAWVPAGKAEFMANVSGEQVRFEEAAIFSEGDAPLEPISLFEGSLRFLTDGYGPSSAFHQLALILSDLELAESARAVQELSAAFAPGLPSEVPAETAGTDAEAEGADRTEPGAS